MSQLDPLVLTIVWNRLVNIAEDMGTALRKTAYSPAVREAEDCACALFDAEARLLAQAVYTPGQMASIPFALQHVLEAFPPETLSPGDGLVLNDPYMGNGHLQDVYAFLPIFYQGHIVGYSGSCAHFTDVGGSAPGSQAVEGILDVYQEGIRIVPVRHFREYQPVPDVFKLIVQNTRTPEYTEGDLLAQMNCCIVGERGVVRLLDEFGTDTVREGIVEIMSRTEERMRDAIQGLPDGRYEGEDVLDDYSAGSEPVRIRVAVTVDGSDLIVDFDGTDPQVPSAINCTYNFTYAYTQFAIMALIAPDLRSNDGARRPLTVVAPEGSLLNPRFPAPCGARAVTIIRVIDAIMKALSPAVPSRATAASSHFANVMLGGVHPENERQFVVFEMMLGGFPARPFRDGDDALVWGFNTGNIPAEIQEAAAPLLVERIELVPDSAGAGQFRGGTGLRKDLRLLTGPMRVSNLTDRHKFPAWGTNGGSHGTAGSIVLNPGAKETQLYSKGVHDLAAGDVISYRVGGAGGWGDPTLRDPEAVRIDVLDGLISSDAAEIHYGVVIRDDAVDREATHQRRKMMRMEKGRIT